MQPTVFQDTQPASEDFIFADLGDKHIIPLWAENIPVPECKELNPVYIHMLHKLDFKEKTVYFLAYWDSSLLEVLRIKNVMEGNNRIWRIYFTDGSFTTTGWNTGSVYIANE